MRVGETQTVSFVVEQHALSNTHSNSSFSNVFDRDPDRLGSSQLSIELSLCAPTTEWQRVETDHVLPVGLEIRMSFEPGLSEARLRG